MPPVFLIQNVDTNPLFAVMLFVMSLPLLFTFVRNTGRPGAPFERPFWLCSGARGLGKNSWKFFSLLISEV